MDKKYIINIQGTDFVKHEGLLNEFFENKGQSITTELIKFEESLSMFIFKATVKGEKGEFTAHGDASPNNVNKMIAPHLARMAETRAVNRALRFYNNIGMCSADELGGDSKPAQSKTTTNVVSSGLKPCDKCNSEFKLVPGGVSKASGKPYNSFYGCSNRDCSRTLRVEDAEMWKA